MYKIIVFIVISFLLIGCGTAPVELTEEDIALLADFPPINPNIPPDPIVLEVWVDLDFTRNNTLLEKLGEDFEKVYPQVKVEVYSFVRESIPQRVDLSRPVPPDVAQGHVYAMAGRGLAEPLEEQWQAWEAIYPEAASQFLPYAMKEVTWNNIRYGIPFDVYTIVLLYNREHFDEANLDYPQGDYDLSYIQNVASILTQPENNRYGVGLTTDPWYAYAWVGVAGSDVTSGDDKTGYQFTLDSETNIDVLRFLTKLIESGYAPLPSSRPRDYEETRKMFLNGEISIYFGELQDINLIQSTNPDFPLGVAPLPKTLAKESKVSVLGSSGLFIPRGALHKEAAFEFMKWAVSDKYITPIGHQTKRFPAKIWLQDDPEFTKNLALTPFFNQLQNAKPYRLDLFPEAEEAFSDAIKSSFYELATPDEALKAAQKAGLRPPTETLFP